MHRNRQQIWQIKQQKITPYYLIFPKEGLKCSFINHQFSNIISIWFIIMLLICFSKPLANIVFHVIIINLKSRKGTCYLLLCVILKCLIINQITEKKVGNVFMIKMCLPSTKSPVHLHRRKQYLHDHSLGNPGRGRVTRLQCKQDVQFS